MPVENLPFIEGFGMIGQVDLALQLTDRTLKVQKDLCPAVYSLWERVLQTSSIGTFDASEINERIHQNGCRP
jgi:hypothetical protein